MSQRDIANEEAQRLERAKQDAQHEAERKELNPSSPQPGPPHHAGLAEPDGTVTTEDGKKPTRSANEALAEERAARVAEEKSTNKRK